MHFFDQEAAIRATMFAWLEQQVTIHGEVLHRDIFLQGFEFQGQRIRMISTGGKGIWRPSIGIEAPLSLFTSANSPYDDRFVGDHLVYDYEGTKPDYWTNRAVRTAYEKQIPLLYIRGIVPSQYLPVWPVYVVGDDPVACKFQLQAEVGEYSLDGRNLVSSLGGASVVQEDVRRAYGTALVRTRLHQRGFREKVLKAYQVRCSICQLRHKELLDAAHILPDAEGGSPKVTNGLSLCKIHHAAFDSRVIGIDPDGYRIVVREDILEEVDGPMLRHGIQAMDGGKLVLPSRLADRPDRELLEVRFERFLGVA